MFLIHRHLLRLLRAGGVWLMLMLVVPAGAAPASWIESLAFHSDERYRELVHQRQELEESLKQLPRLPNGQQSERLGYHSAFSRPGATTKWVQIDLDHPQPIDSIVLVPVQSVDGANAGADYGFPLRYRIEVANAIEPADWRSVADRADADQPGPGSYPVQIQTPGATARFVRLTATKLFVRGDRSFMALGELMVLHGQRNIAAGLPAKQVTASDDYQNPPVWQRENLVDGQSLLGPPVADGAVAGNGYHSAIEVRPDVAKWVQVDLGRVMSLDEIRLFPARPIDFPDRRGFGFPRRFRVEAATEPDFREPVLIADQTGDDFINPAENPVSFPAFGIKGRYVRLTATRLWERNHDFVFALAELQAWSGDTNVALRAPVVALDSIENRTWGKNFLVDGANSSSRLGDWPTWIKGLVERQSKERALAGVLIAKTQELERFTALVTGGGITVALLFGLGGLAAAYRSRWQRQREEEQLRQRIAQDLHDEIGSNLGGIAVLSELAGRQPETAPAVQHEFSEINRMARQTADSMRDLVWLLRTDEEGDLLAHMREAAGVLLAGSDWIFNIGAGVTLDKLSLDARRHLFLAFKEILHNVSRHASAKKVSINLSREGDRLQLQVEDDGCGFVMEQTNGDGSGLPGLHRRATAMQGTCEIISQPGRGTRITIWLPV